MSTDGSTGGGAASSGVGQSTGAASSTGGVGSSGIQSTGAQSMGWGDDWRQRMAAVSTDPDKDVKQLERYESPEQVWKKARELERRMSSGELRSSLRAGASPAEIATWRKENGIPEKPEDYKITMPAGRQAPKEDDAFLKSFMKSAHEANYTQPQVDRAIAVFYAEVDRQEQAIGEAEKAAEQATDDKLHQMWGADYRPNKAMAEALLARAPAGFRDRFMNGYLADRTPIKASPEAWTWLVQMEREINPAASVMPGAGGDVGKTIDARIIELKGMMGNQNSEYWKGPKAESLQEEYRKLLDAQSKMAAKAA